MKTGVLSLVTLSLFTILTASSDVSAQGRGRGRYRDGWDRKCEKFVNCHDARDGRWDGRGLRRLVLSRSWYSPYYSNQYYYGDRYGDRYYGDRYYGNRYYGSRDRYYRRDRYYGSYRLGRVYSPERVYIRTYRRW